MNTLVVHYPILHQQRHCRLQHRNSEDICNRPPSTSVQILTLLFHAATTFLFLFFFKILLRKFKKIQQSLKNFTVKICTPISLLYH